MIVSLELVKDLPLQDYTDTLEKKILKTVKMISVWIFQIGLIYARNLSQNYSDYTYESAEQAN